MERDPDRVLTVEEARNLPPPTPEEIAARRAWAERARALSLRIEERLGRPITMEEIYWAIDHDTDDDDLPETPGAPK